MAEVTARPVPILTERQHTNFWKHVAVPAQPSCCWEWTASKHRGYGQFNISGRIFRAHRVALAILVEDPPQNREIDHLCRNRACVNPDHLRPATRRENQLAGYGPSAHSPRTNTCKQGHALTPDNIITKPSVKGARLCRTCDTARHRKSYRKTYQPKRKEVSHA